MELHASTWHTLVSELNFLLGVGKTRWFAMIFIMKMATNDIKWNRFGGKTYEAAVRTIVVGELGILNCLKWTGRYL